MKTFYEIADIKDTITMMVEIKFKTHEGDPIVFLKLNSPFGVKLDINNQQPGVWDNIPLMDPIDIEMSVTGGSVHIESLTVDGFEVIPKYQHLADPQTAFLNDGEHWTLNIPAPFYPWYHKITGHGWII